MAEQAPTMSIAEAAAFLTGEGGFFETAEEEVHGRTMAVVKDRVRNLRDLVAASERFADATYYVFDDDRQASFDDNVGHAAAAAAAFRQDFGVEPGDRVAILGANDPAWIQAFWGSVVGGSVAVAMNGWWKSDEIRYGLEMTEPKVLIADERRLERLEGDPGVPVVVMEGEFDELLAAHAGAALPDNPIAEDDLAALLFTSGTTGRPKGAMQTHRNFSAYVNLAFFIGAIGAVRFPSDGESVTHVGLAASPLFHVSGLHAQAVTALATGLKGVWTTGRFDPEKILRLTEEHDITRWGGVTTQMWRLIEHPNFHDYDTSSVVSIGGGGSVWSPELQRACRAALPHAGQAIGIGYGLTESSGLATSAPSDILAEHPDSVGCALPTVELRILDEHDNELPDGEIGNVCVRGPNIMPGYWRNPEATAETIRPGGWLRTGDFGRVEDDILYLASRRSDLIIRGGENIYPVEIENRLDEHAAVSESCVVGVDHRELGQEVKAVVVLRDGRSATEDELAEFARGGLADFKVPAHWELRTEALPRNATGKILRHVVTGDAENTFIEE